MRSAFAVANQIIRCAARDNASVCGNQLQCLIYFAHGLRLALVNEPLLDEAILANRDGVFIASLNAAGVRGTSRLKGMLLQWRNAPNGCLEEITPLLDDDDRALPTLDLVWNRFGSFGNYDLNMFVRSTDGPWDETWNDPERLAEKLSESITQVWVERGDDPDKGVQVLNSVIRRWFRQLVILEQKEKASADGLEHTIHVARERAAETIRVEKERLLRAL